MMTADRLRLTAYGPDGNEMRLVEDSHKAKPPFGPTSATRNSGFGSPQSRSQSWSQIGARGGPALSSAQARPYVAAPVWLPGLHSLPTLVSCPVTRSLLAPGGRSLEGSRSYYGGCPRRHPRGRPHDSPPDDAGAGSWGRQGTGAVNRQGRRYWGYPRKYS